MLGPQEELSTSTLSVQKSTRQDTYLFSTVLLGVLINFRLKFNQNQFSQILIPNFDWLYTKKPQIMIFSSFLLMLATNTWSLHKKKYFHSKWSYFGKFTMCLSIVSKSWSILNRISSDSVYTSCLHNTRVAWVDSSCFLLRTYK